MNSEIVPVFELSIKLSPTELKIIRRKYKTKETSINYVPVDVTKEDYEEGFEYHGSSRIKKTSILRLSKGFGGDSFNCLRRYVLYLDGQEEQAKNLILDSIEKTLSDGINNLTSMFNRWGVEKPFGPKKDKDKELEKCCNGENIQCSEFP